jgi:molybdopterin/thiamine biosynthesis adenylyltransferase
LAVKVQIPLAMNDLFARVRPLVGAALDSCQVAVVGSCAASSLVEYLVACGVRRWLFMAGNEWSAALATRIGDHYGSRLDITWVSVTSLSDMAEADLLLAVDATDLVSHAPLTLPRLAVCTSAGGQSILAMLAMPGEPLYLPEPPDGHFLGRWNWLTAAPLVALWARALLLRGTAYRMAAWEDAWQRGMRAYAIGANDDPTAALWQAHMATREEESPTYRTPLTRQGTLLIAGLGSLGSVAAQQLVLGVARLVVIDPDPVEIENLVRQAYSWRQLGQPKALALAEALHEAHSELEVEPVMVSLTDEGQVADLIQAYGVTAALVTTGTQADFAIARGLRTAGIPHVVGRCYARGRFWEGIVVAGGAGPSYEQVRRAVTAGPPAAPTPEEIASYGAVGDLAGEPAMAMETGWAAIWLARLTAQIMAPANLREGWMLARLAAGATCFVGGVVVEQGTHGPAYAIRVPGQVHAWSVAQIGS